MSRSQEGEERECSLHCNESWVSIRYIHEMVNLYHMPCNLDSLSEDWLGSMELLSAVFWLLPVPKHYAAFLRDL